MDATRMTVRLPLAEAAARACGPCHALCCEIYVVHLGGHDLWRLVRGLDLPWRAVAELSPHPAPASISFRLDGGGARHALSLRRRESGACGFLLELPGGLRRCGVHAFRPWACRAYPLEIAPAAPEWVAARSDACCPDGGLRAWTAAIPEASDPPCDDRGEEVLWRHALRRWDGHAERFPSDRPLAPDSFVAWVLDLYDAIAPLRGPERGEWQLGAIDRIEAFPLPPE
jgi:Fe-S-cluster containining protein